LVNPNRLEVHDIAGNVRGLVTQRHTYPALRYFMLGSDVLILCTGKRNKFHTLRWGLPKLAVSRLTPLASRSALASGPGQKSLGEVLKVLPQEWLARLSLSATTQQAVAACVDYDGDRFTKASLLMDRFAVADRFGQVAVLDRSRKLVCMVLAFHDELAIWLPDGTCYGPAWLTGRPATPNALEKIARALKRASQEGERT
jgi:MoxR-vWA-beta-propeller ternary system domain bpX1